MPIPSAKSFIKEYTRHKILSKKTLEKLNRTYLHERVYVTLSSHDTFNRVKTAGVITDINDTLGKHFRFTIVTEQGRELILLQEPATNKAIVQGSLMNVQLEVC